MERELQAVINGHYCRAKTARRDQSKLVQDPNSTDDPSGANGTSFLSDACKQAIVISLMAHSVHCSFCKKIPYFFI